MEQFQKKEHSYGEKGYVFVLLVFFLAIVVTFLLALGPLCQRIITEIEIRHAVDVATLKGVHAEAEILNTLTSMNHTLLFLYGAIVGSLIIPGLQEAIPTFIECAKVIAKIQDEIVKDVPFGIGAIISFESSIRNKLFIYPTSSQSINVKRSPTLFGIPGILILEDDYEEDLKVNVSGTKVKILMNEKLHIAQTTAEGEPDGESLLKANWRTKPLQ